MSYVIVFDRDGFIRREIIPDETADVTVASALQPGEYSIVLDQAVTSREQAEALANDAAGQLRARGV